MKERRKYVVMTTVGEVELSKGSYLSLMKRKRKENKHKNIMKKASNRNENNNISVGKS